MLNTIRVMLVGSVLAKATRGGCAKSAGPKTYGEVVFVEKPDELSAFANRRSNLILVCKDLTEDFIPLLRLVNGVVAEHDCTIPESVLQIVNPDLVWLINAPGAFSALETGLAVTLDGKNLMIYEGFV